MSINSYPDAISGKVVEEVQDSPASGDIVYLTLTKQLELRTKSDLALRSSIDALVEELREVKMLLQLLVVGR